MSYLDVVYPIKKAVRNLYRPETTDKGQVIVSDGVEELVFKTTIDLSALQDMARKAAKNVTSKSTDGPITVEILSRQRIR